MTRICENCPNPMLWNDFKQSWECPNCDHKEGDAFQGDNKGPIGYLD